MNCAACAERLTRGVSQLCFNRMQHSTYTPLVNHIESRKAWALASLALGGFISVRSRRLLSQSSRIKFRHNGPKNVAKTGKEDQREKVLQIKDKNDGTNTSTALRDVPEIPNKMPDLVLGDKGGSRGTSLEQWQIQKKAHERKFKGESWKPKKRVSPDALEGIRALHAKDPVQFSTPVLANQFKISPEAIRRILRSKWRPTEEEQENRIARWDRRGEKKWSEMVKLGMKPPKKWREMGVGRPKPGHLPAWKKSKYDSQAKPRESLASNQKGPPKIPVKHAWKDNEEGEGNLMVDRIL